MNFLEKLHWAVMGLVIGAIFDNFVSGHLAMGALGVVIIVVAIVVDRVSLRHPS